jgi:copper oxidase (laccase) domain-containing protein
MAGAAPLRWILPHGVQVAYSTIADGDQRDREQRHAWLASQGVSRCVVPRQVHGVRIVQHDADSDALAQADGVVGDGRVALGAFGADCPGLVLVAEDALGVAHCGWRGVAGGIVAQVVEALRTFSRHVPARWHAFIGPGISGPRYEVDAPVLSARSWPAAALRPARPGRSYLDIAATITADLAACGLHTVTQAQVCTVDDERLWSYRRRGAGQVQLLAAWRT